MYLASKQCIFDHQEVTNNMKKYTNTDKTWHFSAKYADVDFVRIFNEVPSDCNLVSIEMGFVKLLAVREAYHKNMASRVRLIGYRPIILNTQYVNLQVGKEIQDWQFCYASNYQYVGTVPQLIPDSLDDIESYFERAEEVKYFSKRKMVMVHVECR